MYTPFEYSKNKILNRFLNYVTKMLIKITEISLSVKVLSVIGITWVNTWLVIEGYISGGNYATVQVALITTVLSMREIFKISKLMCDKENKNKDLTP